MGHDDPAGSAGREGLAGSSGPGDLADLRARIDAVDADLVALLGRRFALTRAVGALKASHGLPPRDPAREAAVQARLAALAGDHAVDPALVRQIMATIMAASAAEQAQAVM